MGKVQEIAPSVSKAGRSKTYHRRGLWAIKKKNGGKLPVHAKAAPKAVATEKTARLYPADDVPKPLRRRSVARPAKLRASLQPGAILILLAGRFKGKRVVLLSALPSGLLLVSGPYSVNGVPLRRVNPAYVIATAASVDVKGVDVSKFGDAYFKAADAKAEKKKTGAPGKKGGDADFFSGGAEAKTKEPLPASVVANQKAVDAALEAKLGDLKGYLATPFSLQKGDRPHLMKF